jgi:hypothetical protein
MTAAAVLARIDDLGLTAIVLDGALRVGPRAKVTTDLQIDIRRNVGALTALVRERQALQAVRQALAAWKAHTFECSECDLTDRRKRCSEAQEFENIYHSAWSRLAAIPVDEEPDAELYGANGGVQ